MNIVWLAADTAGEWNTSAHRVITPAKVLASARHRCYVAHIAEITSGHISGKTLAEIDQANVIVIERLCIAETHGFINLQRGAGKQVWVTFDDNYALMPDGVSKMAWRGGKKALGGRGSILSEFRAGLRLATGFMTPSRLLCEDYAMYNDRAAYVPNYLDANLWSNMPSPHPDVFTIGYGGTSLHNISLKESGIILALGKLCQQYPRMQVHLQPAFSDVVTHFKRAGVRYSLGRWERFDAWPKTVSQFKIGLAPLSGNYDMRRSNLKVLEYAMLGIPWVATDGPPYAEARGGILVENKPKDWYRVLRELTENQSLYDDLATKGRAWAESHNAQCVSRYEEIFNERI
jgi:hypothetical protein